MHDDYFQIYLEELEAVLPFGEGEEEELLRLASLRDEQARSRLIEGKLRTALAWAREYESHSFIPLKAASIPAKNRLGSMKNSLKEQSRNS